jgi:hypothetical protein
MIKIEGGVPPIQNIPQLPGTRRKRAGEPVEQEITDTVTISDETKAELNKTINK